MSTVVVRAYDPARDAAGLRACFVELQDYERSVGREVPPGEVVADAYVAFMLDCCTRFAGTVFVADTGGAVVGFVSVWANVPPEQPDESPVPYGFVSDLVVAERHRGAGIGRSLLHRAEEYVRAYGATSLRIGVAARNPARQWYEAEGFSERYVLFGKPLSPAAGAAPREAGR